jgi:hypothetical protein
MNNNFDTILRTISSPGIHLSTFCRKVNPDYGFLYHKQKWYRYGNQMSQYELEQFYITEQIDKWQNLA